VTPSIIKGNLKECAVPLLCHIFFLLTAENFIPNLDIHGLSATLDELSKHRCLFVALGICFLRNANYNETFL